MKHFATILLSAMSLTFMPFSSAAVSVSESVSGVRPAEDTDADDVDIDPFLLGEMVVTGTRTPRLLKDTPVQTTVISARDIEKSDATDIRDLLQAEMPGVEFSYAMNQQVHMNFAGFGGQSVLFLIDGERLAGETMDDVDFSRLDMGNVERIEIVKGASSAVYGSNAGGGVINIITRKAQKAVSGEVDARIGRHNSQRYGLSLSNRYKWLRNVLTAGYNSIDNYNVTNAPDPVARVVSTIYGQRVFDIRDRLSVSPVENLTITGRAGFFYRQLSRTADSPERYRDYSGGLRADWKISDNDNLEVSYSFDQYDKSDFYRITGLDVRSYSNVQNALRGFFSHDFQGNILSVGADYMRDYLMNAKLEDRVHIQHTFDMFGQFDWVIDPKWEVVGALRLDHISDGGMTRVTPKISARWQPRSDLNVRMAYGMGFRAPTLKEKYYEFDMSGIWIVKGNPELKAETSHNINASVDWQKSNYNFTVTAYYNNVADRITTGLPYYLPGETDQLYLDYINLRHYSVYGGDVTLQGAWGCGVSAKLSYAWCRESVARNSDGSELNSQYIPLRPHSLTARVDWKREFSDKYALTVGINGRVLSGVDNKEYADYYDIAKGTVDVRYPAYTIWKLSVGQTFFSRFRLTLALDNIFNYRPKYYYLNAPLTDGIDFQAGLSISF